MTIGRVTKTSSESITYRPVECERQNAVETAFSTISWRRSKSLKWLKIQALASRMGFKITIEDQGLHNPYRISRCGQRPTNFPTMFAKFTSFKALCSLFIDTGFDNLKTQSMPQLRYRCKYANCGKHTADGPFDDFDLGICQITFCRKL